MLAQYIINIINKHIFNEESLIIFLMCQLFYHHRRLQHLSFRCIFVETFHSLRGKYSLRQLQRHHHYDYHHHHQLHHGRFGEGLVGQQFPGPHSPLQKNHSLSFIFLTTILLRMLLVSIQLSEVICSSRLIREHGYINSSNPY